MASTKTIRLAQKQEATCVSSEHRDSFAGANEKRYALAPTLKPEERLLEQGQSCKIRTNGKRELSDSVNLADLGQNSAPDSSKPEEEALQFGTGNSMGGGGALMHDCVMRVGGVLFTSGGYWVSFSTCENRKHIPDPFEIQEKDVQPRSDASSHA